MSLIWKITLGGGEVGRFLFTKVSSTEAKCNVCDKTIQTPYRGTTNLKQHLSKHPEYQKKFNELERAGELKKNALQDGMAKFVVRGSGELSAVDRKVMHFIACSNQPFAVVEQKTFKVLLSSTDRENLKFGLTAHGIDANWKRHKFILCVRHFPGEHNFETTRGYLSTNYCMFGTRCIEVHRLRGRSTGIIEDKRDYVSDTGQGGATLSLSSGYKSTQRTTFLGSQGRLRLQKIQLESAECRTADIVEQKSPIAEFYVLDLLLKLMRYKIIS